MSKQNKKSLPFNKDNLSRYRGVIGALGLMMFVVVLGIIGTPHKQPQSSTSENSTKATPDVLNDYSLQVEDTTVEPSASTNAGLQGSTLDAAAAQNAQGLQNIQNSQSLQALKDSQGLQGNSPNSLQSVDQ